MATMLAKVYAAFEKAGTSDDKARAVASAIANHENRFQGMEIDTVVLKRMVRASVAFSLSLSATAFF